MQKERNITFPDPSNVSHVTTVAALCDTLTIFDHADEATTITN